ncbi:MULTISPECIES: hypothetical protein [Terrilactibacillus]|uniref:Uncharacterized protein n=2 Tax=Terrilactibacillus TaxID=1795633 RepID=A0A6N8CQ41_9BACI|nr:MULTISPECIES: hypothetical protein [Terrilactibacillus]MTT32151.1 hypothetical protein [Terrilactibacillus tamarindi]
MTKFSFFIEYDGRKSHLAENSQPIETILADDVKKAIEQFAKKNKLHEVDYDDLQQGGYRVFFKQSRMFAKKREQIYYIIPE